MNKDYTAFTAEKVGSKVILRLLEKNDLERSLQWLTDPLVNKYLSHNFKDLTNEQEEKWFNYIQESEQDIVFAILDRETGLHIGNCALHKINRKKHSSELGIVIGEKQYWDKGYGTDAVKTLLRFALGGLGLSIIRLNVFKYNKRAIKAYSRCGFKTVKVLKNRHLYNGKYWDTIIMEYMNGYIEN
jgi:RimJ/RimL family protein N-acetyltransferase